jgi:hypothetical protein
MPPDSTHIVPSTTRYTTTISKMGPMIVMGLLELRVLRQNLLGSSAPPRGNRARDKVIQRIDSSWCYPGSH